MTDPQEHNEGVPGQEPGTGDDGFVAAEGPDVETPTGGEGPFSDADQAFLDGLSSPEAPAGTDEAAEHLADLRRLTAEYANYRRRVERDREATVTAAKAQVAGELLTVLDDVERAGAHGDLTGPFKVVADRLTETLTRAGLTGFGEVGDTFDPSVHEAVAHGTSAEVDGPTVTIVMRRGYRFGEKVLRPAMVEVTDHDPDAVPAGSGPTGGSENA
jgi:molecular chaperone GrpE